MKPKPPPLPSLPPVVPPDYRVVVAESSTDLETQVNEALAAGQQLEPNAAQLYAVAGAVVMTQVCTRDPQHDKRVRTRLSTQRVINQGGVL